VPGPITELHDFEDTTREQASAERLAAGQGRNVPVLGRLVADLRERQDRGLPESRHRHEIGFVL
jgi:hypothetical protein